MDKILSLRLCLMVTVSVGTFRRYALLTSTVLLAFFCYFVEQIFRHCVVFEQRLITRRFPISAHNLDAYILVKFLVEGY